jgi:3-oxoacyl-[acyl-carrier protein] reductase
MELNLRGKNAIVTGGGRGLGREICLELAKEGVNITVNYRSNGQRARRTVGDLLALGIKAAAVKGDVANENDVAALFDSAEQALGTISLLVNNAGLCPVIKIRDMDYAVWKQMMDVNLSGMFLCCREFIRRLPKDEKGAVVNISSVAAYVGSKNGKTAYSASKGGVVSFTASLAKELATDGIRVNAVAPGMMYTDMTAEALDRKREQYNAQIPMGRIGELDETARMVAFLLSDASSYTTGTTIDISGGMIGR